ACCFRYMSHRIPRRYISSAYVTNSMCTQPGVILVTKMGREICVDPQAPWVQEYLERFQILKN
ncbi:CCL3 protein, partial [Pelecanoides urinatrix]|nr:CCL3 protein [Pelecanoides urinatrix]